MASQAHSWYESRVPLRDELLEVISDQLHAVLAPSAA
jgi:hypothetical protein